MSITINPPPGPWTVADLDTLPDVGYRFEIHEGKLVMMSPVTIWHSRVMRRVTQALASAGRSAEMEVGVKRNDRSLRVADVAVFRSPPTAVNRAYWAPEDLTLVVEIVSDSSQDDDRFVKPRWYAQAGIPEYWRVEQGEDGEAVIYQYSLARTADGVAAYVETGVTTLAALEAE
jgi:Uma2 family endonuclease